MTAKFFKVPKRDSKNSEEIYEDYLKLLNEFRNSILSFSRDSRLDGAQISWILEEVEKVVIPIDYIDRYIWELEESGAFMRCF